MNLDALRDGDQLLALTLPFGTRLATALLIFFIGRWIVDRLVLLLQRLMRRGGSDEMLCGFVGNVAWGLGLALVVISALGQLGVDTTSAAAVVGGATLAIGLSLQGTLASFAAGVMLVVFRPFRRGDAVTVGGVSGIVEEIKIVATALRTPDNQIITVPNAAVWAGTITNSTALATRCIDLSLPVSHANDYAKVRGALEAVLAVEASVLRTPAATVVIKDLTAGAVIYGVLAWVATADYPTTRAALLDAIKRRFDADGITIPNPPAPPAVLQLAK